MHEMMTIPVGADGGQGSKSQDMKLLCPLITYQIFSKIQHTPDILSVRARSKGFLCEIITAWAHVKKKVKITKWSSMRIFNDDVI